MNWKRVALALGATAIAGVGVYAGSGLLNPSNNSGNGNEPIQLAEPSELVTEAISTDCGLTNANDDTTAKSGVVSASVTRARVTASQDVDEGMDVAAAIEAGDCRFRLDGIWTEDLPLALDTSFEVDGFSSMSGGSLDPSLLHSTFVTPRVLMIEAEEDASLLTIRDATDPQNVVTARQEDETPLSDVFTANGTRKTYLLNKNLSSDVVNTSSMRRIDVDVTRTGRVRLRIEGTNYYRPTTDAFGDKETASTNAWMIERNLDNLDASLKGYDAYSQDLFQLNTNSKGRVFEAADPDKYTVTEKRTVPLGFKLVSEGAQGSVMSSELIRTEREYQRTVTVSLGMNVGFEGESAAGGIGANYTDSKTEGMREANARSITNGYGRHKIYALVLDQPFARLSDEFVDAIEDARRYGRYDELIERFGTHYPYAVTYGSAAKMYAEFEESQLNEWQSKSEDINGNAGLAIGGFGASISAGRFEENREADSLLESTEYKDFLAVGGTGSWNQDGFGSGTPYPILADIRPLYQLLNPLNFPGEPEIYTKVREELRVATAEYLAQFGQDLSDKRPRVEMTYEIKPLRIYCRNGANGLPKGLETNPQHLIDGSVRLELGNGTQIFGTKNSGTRTWSDMKINCWYGEPRSKSLDLQPIRLTGTYEEISQATLNWHVNLKTERVTLIRNNRAYANKTSWGFSVPPIFKVGGTQDVTKVIRKRSANLPELHLIAEVKRVR